MRGGRRPLEIGDREQRLGVELLTKVGACVMSIGTRRGRGGRCPSCAAFVPNQDHSTRQTPGIADVLFFLPMRLDRPARGCWWESKAGSGRLSKDQAAFRTWCLEVGWDHVVGGVNELYAYLVEHGRVKAENVPHYRRPHVHE